MTTFAKIKAIASGEVGTREGGKPGHYNNDQKYSDEVPGLEWSDGQPWCATFVSWVAMKAGAADLYPRTASCDVAGKWFKDAKRWSEFPALGAQVFYGTPADLTHTGIVIGYDSDYIYTVEGNTNDEGSREGFEVAFRKRARKDDWIVGYGYPKFAAGIDSADPKYAKPKAAAPAPVKVPAPAKPPAPSVSLSALQRAGKVAAWTHALPNKGTREDVQQVQVALKAEGVRTYAQWQKRNSIAPATGLPDKKSLVLLGKRNGFKVTA